MNCDTVRAKLSFEAERTKFEDSPSITATLTALFLCYQVEDMIVLRCYPPFHIKVFGIKILNIPVSSEAVNEYGKLTISPTRRMFSPLTTSIPRGTSA
jgi:hypothetical protein